MSFETDLITHIETELATATHASLPHLDAGIASYHAVLAAGIGSGVFDSYGTGGGGGGGATLPIVLTTDVSGILPVANGGTGSGSAPAGGFEGKTYIDAGDASTLASAETYADAGDATNATAITSEATTRASADTTLTTNLATETTNRTNADTTLTNNLATETTNRTNADTTLQTNINSEATTRAANDTTLQTNITSEATTRAANDTANLATAEAYADTAKLAAEAAAVHEISLAAGVFAVVSTSYVRVGARLIDMSKYPTISGYTRHVRFVVDIDKTSGATSGTVQLYDVTNNVLVTSTNMTTTSNSNDEHDSGDLTVGNAAGNIQLATPASYELQLKVTGGTLGVDGTFLTSARLLIYYV